MYVITESFVHFNCKDVADSSYFCQVLSKFNITITFKIKHLTLK
jgi:hypothetical protein